VVVGFRFFGPYYVKVGVLIVLGAAVAALFIFLNRTPRR